MKASHNNLFYGVARGFHAEDSFCLRRQDHHRRGATRVLRSSADSTRLLLPCRSIASEKRCGPIVWRGSTQILEARAKERFRI